MISLLGIGLTLIGAAKEHMTIVWIGIAITAIGFLARAITWRP